MRPCRAVQGDDLLGMDLKQAGRRDRADRKSAFRALEAQPGARAAGDQDDADLAGGQRIGPHPPARRRDHALAVGLRQPDHLDRLHPLRLRNRRPHRRAPARRSAGRAARNRSTRLPPPAELARPRSGRPTIARGGFARAGSSDRRGRGRETSRAKLLRTVQAARDPTRETRIPLKTPVAARHKPGPLRRELLLRGAMIEAVRQMRQERPAAASASRPRRGPRSTKSASDAARTAMRPEPARPAPASSGQLSSGIRLTSVQYARSPTRKPSTGDLPCSSRIGRIRWPSTSNSTPGATRDELELGNEARRPLLGAGPKRVAENAPDRVFGVLLAIDRHRPAGPARKLAGIIEPEQVVGMGVRERDRMDPPDPLAQELNPHLGRRVDEQVTRRKRQQHAGPRPLVARIGRRADRAVAADHGNAAGRSGSQKNQPALGAPPPSINRPTSQWLS